MVPQPRIGFGAPRRFGPYVLTECLGKGGTAVIYKGKRSGVSGFEKQVVVKTILPELARDFRFVRLFNREAKLSAQLFHANVAQVQDFGVVSGTPFLELEYLSGWNLQQLWNQVAARGERLPVGIALLLATEACRGLSYAHAFVDEAGVHRPIIHRDISPANVMICRDGAVKLLDFGLASLTRGETLSIETFQGKLAYMSPEQLERKQVDRRADVFAFGALLHELLTGQRLFRGETDVETVQRVRSLAIEPPSGLNDRVPAALDVIVLRALARNPDQRYQSAAELLDALDGLSGQQASRKELLAYLGSVAPEVFTTPCDGCGARVPNGAECSECRTLIDDRPPDLAPVLLAPPARPPAWSIHWQRFAQLLQLVLLLVLDRLAGWRR
jgi:serine/threonine protein kinase